MRAQRIIDRRPATQPSGRRPGRALARRLLAITTALVAVVVLAASVSLVGTLASPSTDDTTTRIAEWARDHGLGPVVTAAEYLQVTVHPAATGGAPDPTLLASLASGPANEAASRPAVLQSNGGLVRAPMSTPVTPALPHEGHFRLAQPDSPLVQYTFVRPDPVHTSYLATVVVFDRSAHFVLHPGTQEPGGPHAWSVPSRITAREQQGLLATFNGGFKLADARGGYADHGQVAGHLVDGAASLVIDQSGHARIGTWGRDVAMTPDIAYVRQNLQPLISDGVIAPDLGSHVRSSWGATVGASTAVWRSGLGQTASGDLVYVAGDALTVTSLADLLHRAGAVNAMQLDINPSWVSVMTYAGTAPHLVAHKVGSFSRPATRYLQTSTRDFVAVYGPGTA